MYPIAVTNRKELRMRIPLSKMNRARWKNWPAHFLFFRIMTISVIQTQVCELFNVWFFRRVYPVVKFFCVWSIIIFQYIWYISEVKFGFSGSAAASHQAKKSRTEISPQTSSKSYMIKDEPNLIDELAASIPGCSNHSDMLTLENADKITSALERKQRQQNLTKPKKTAIILGRLYQPKGVTCSISASSSISNPRMEISEPNNENNMRTEPENSSTSCVVKVGPNLINVMLTPLDPGISNNGKWASVRNLRAYNFGSFQRIEITSFRDWPLYVIVLCVA